MAQLPPKIPSEFDRLRGLYILLRLGGFAVEASAQCNAASRTCDQVTAQPSLRLALRIILISEEDKPFGRLIHPKNGEISSSIRVLVASTYQQSSKQITVNLLG